MARSQAGRMNAVGSSLWRKCDLELIGPKEIVVLEKCTGLLWMALCEEYTNDDWEVRRSINVELQH